jgi:DNA-binding GntR family transcriptional regulator
MNKSNQSDKSLGITAARFARLDLNAALRERKTTSDYIAEALRAAIYDGQFEDGEELNQVELAEHFKVSRVPVREALRQLKAEGLVNNVAHRRSIVVGLDLSEILEQIEIRAVLERHLVEKAGPRLEARRLKQFQVLCDEMDSITDYDHAWVRKNWEYHRGLYQRAEAPATIALVEQIHLKIERYVRRAGGSERLRQAAAEHRDILTAIERGDFREAAELMERHILHNGDQVRRYFAETGLSTDAGS